VGKYLVAMNKITKDRYLPTGPELSQSAQLIDISGRQDEDAARLPDDRRAALRPGDRGEPRSRTSRSSSTSSPRTPIPWVTKSEADGGITRTGKKIDIKMIAIRSHFAPDNIEGVQVGDTVQFHVTNIEQDWDILHGFAVLGAQTSELILQPGETRTLTWIPRGPGVYPFYCTDFCSALHQEMQGYIRVSPAGSSVKLMANVSKKAQAQLAEAKKEK
jgi:nitrous-oxide reductase